MYKICAVIFCQADSNAFDKTLSSLENSSIFDETYFLFVFNDLYKQSSKHGKPIFEKEDMPRSNMKYLFTFTESFIEELERAITESGCDIVAPIFEGDTIDPYYLEYICYFFDENKDECKVVFATVVKPEQPEETDFGELPCGGVAAFDKDRNMPLTDRGFAFISGSFIEALTAGSGAWFFPEAVYKIIMTTGYYGMLATVKYYAEKNVEFPTFVLERLAENSIELYGELPFFLRNTIEKRLDEALLAPVIGSAPDVLSLYKYILEQFMDSRITPSVELISVQNYFEDMEIKGLYHYSRDIDPKEDFTLDTEAEYYDFIIRPVENTNADKLWPKAEFSAKLKLADNSVRVTFNQNGQPVSEIITPESGRNGNYEISRVGDDICFNKIAPRSFYKVSVIIPIYNGSDFLKEAIDSLKAQTLDFFVNIQIILVNDGSDDSTLEICREYVKKYPYNVCYIEQDRQGVSAARNSGLRLAMGKYTAFLDADDKLPPQFLETGVKFFEKQGAEVDVAAFPIQYFNQGEDTKQTASANYRFDKTRIVDINKDFDYVQFSACSAVFRTSALAGLSFDTRLSYCEDAEFTHKVLLNKMKYGVIKEPAYLYRTGGAATGGKRPVAAWKTRKGLLGKFLVDYALAQRGEVSEYTQYLIIHELQDNLSDQFYDGDDDTETEEILNVISETLTYVDDGLIKSAKRLNYWFRYYLLKLKHGLLELRNIDGKYGFYFGETLFENLEPRLNICSIAERDSILWIWGSFSLPMYDGIKFTADFNGEKYVADFNSDSKIDLYFMNRSAHKTCFIKLRIPAQEEGDLSFNIYLNDGGKLPVRLTYADSAPITEKQTNFFFGKNLLLSKTPEVNTLRAEPLNKESVERTVRANLKKSADETAAVFKNYLEMYTMLKTSRIWLFMDEPRAAGSNADILFNYCVGIKDGIEKYFVIEKDTLDSVRLEDVGTVIERGSDMHKLLYLFCEKIITSDIASAAYNPYPESVPVKALANYDLIYLPRTILTQNELSTVIKDYTRNLRLIAVSTDTEPQMIKEAVRGLYNDAVHITGLPAQDNLRDMGEKAILFMPDFRKELYLGENQYNYEFESSEYCERISELMCDERLIEAAEEYEYEIIFAPHEKIILNLGDIDIDDSVTLATTEYTRETLFSAASLLITDCTPVYEYIYMKKPVIYYDFAGAEQPDALFGETFSEHDALVDAIIGCMAAGCEMKDEYRRKSEEFYRFNDQNNSKRVYNAILALDEQR